MRVRDTPVDRGHSFKIMDVASSGQRDGRARHASDEVPVTVVKSGDRFETMRMVDAARSGSGSSGIVMTVSDIVRSGAGEVMRMHGTLVPMRDVQLVRMSAVFPRMNDKSRNRNFHIQSSFP